MVYLFAGTFETTLKRRGVFPEVMKQTRLVRRMFYAERLAK